MRMLVTGGNIGNPVAEMLAAKGVPVRVLVRSISPNRAWDAAGIEQVAGDFADPESLRPAFAGVDRFLSVTPYVESLAQFGVNSIVAARAAHVRYIVRASWLGADDSGDGLRRWHRIVEHAVEDSGIPFTILRPNTFMQSYLTNAASIKAANAFYMSQGDGKVSLIDVRDIAAVAAICLSEPGHEGKTYALTGPEALSNGGIAQKLTQLLGRAIEYVDMSSADLGKSMTGAGLPGWMVRTLLELFELSKSGRFAPVSPDVQRILRREPRTFDGFLTESAAAFR